MGEPGISQLKPLEALARPGLSWTPAEREAVCEWLLEEARYRQLLRFALRLLGENAVAADAEEAVGDFCLKKLPGIMARFDPSRSSSQSPFWSFVISCLHQFCANFKLSRERQRMFLVRSDEDPELLEKIIDNVELERLIGRESLAEVRRALRIMPRHFSRILLLALKGKNTTEIARELGITNANAKTRLSRARNLLRGLINRGSNRT
jgi:RNA polymerase sigma factor (sigma-70 family)